MLGHDHWIAKLGTAQSRFERASANSSRDRILNQLRGRAEKTRYASLGDIPFDLPDLFLIEEEPGSGKGVALATGEMSGELRSWIIEGGDEAE